MILRALILLGWNKTETPGANPVQVVYCGNDGIALAEAHLAAQQTGDFVAFRKIINPSGIPMPLTVDPAPKPPVFPKAEIPEHEPSLDKRLKAADAQLAKEREQAAAKRAAEDKANAEKQAIADAADKAFKTFTALNAKTKPELMADVEAFNETATEENKIKLATDAKKSDVVAALMKAQSLSVPESK